VLASHIANYSNDLWLMPIVQILPIVFSGIQLRPDSLFFVGGVVLNLGQHDYRHFD